MLTNAMLPVLKSLKLYGMAHALADLAEQDSPAFQASINVLDHLLKAELAEREVRSVAYQLKAAKFPAYRDVMVSTSLRAWPMRRLSGNYARGLYG